ncbi:MAG: hypothetical protein PHY73_02070 [Candidatus Omnitrophica bacterium]|nr:hypothetical protein [Candidatus Omnitrophota bacterium]
MKKLLIVLLCLFLAGCSTVYYEVGVSSLAGGRIAPASKNYLVASGNKGTTSDDLQFIEFATYVKRGLAEKGFKIVDKPEEANAIIFLSYGIGNPVEHTYTYSVPIYGQTGVSSSYTTGNAYSFGNNTNFSASTTYMPTYGTVGSSLQQITTVTYRRYINLEAYDFDITNKANQNTQLWKTEIESSGWSGDLRAVFPPLVAASFQFFGENTRRKVYVKIQGNDKRIFDIATDKQLVLAVKYNNEAYGLYKKGIELERGIELVDKALEMYPDNGIFLSTKAEILYKLGDYNSAYDYIKRGLELEPNHLEMKEDLKRIEKALNKTNEEANK